MKQLRKQVMEKEQSNTKEDEVLFDHLKDQFAFFYALTIAGMESFKHVRQHYHKKHLEDKKSLLP